MAVALRILILLAGLIGYLFHQAMAVHSSFKELPKMELALAAWNAQLSLWFAAPYVVLALGAGFTQTKALWVVLFAMIALTPFDAYMYSNFGTTGWYVVLAPIYLMVPVCIGLAVAWFLNWVGSPDEPSEEEGPPQIGRPVGRDDE